MLIMTRETEKTMEVDDDGLRLPSRPRHFQPKLSPALAKSGPVLAGKDASRKQAELDTRARLLVSHQNTNFNGATVVKWEDLLRNRNDNVLRPKLDWPTDTSTASFKDRSLQQAASRRMLENLIKPGSEEREEALKRKSKDSDDCEEDPQAWVYYERRNQERQAAREAKIRAREAKKARQEKLKKERKEQQILEQQRREQENEERELQRKRKEELQAQEMRRKEEAKAREQERREEAKAREQERKAREQERRAREEARRIRDAAKEETRKVRDAEREESRRVRDASRALEEARRAEQARNEQVLQEAHELAREAEHERQRSLREALRLEQAAKRVEARRRPREPRPRDSFIASTALALQELRDAERDRQRVISTEVIASLGVPPRDEYSSNDDSPPYREKLHKYLDLMSYDERFTPILRVNRYLIHGESELMDAIEQFSLTNLLPQTTNLWAISHIDDTEYENMIPVLIPEHAYYQNELISPQLIPDF